MPRFTLQSHNYLAFTSTRHECAGYLVKETLEILSSPAYEGSTAVIMAPGEIVQILGWAVVGCESLRGAYT
ncbi:hypothetical protein DL546_009036 [Coniochaeta pulveracea]|uniref:Uncharacterized protein n=1 Tax=Coniochaeta pulveracea TaxID=177199 RepID=A0A420YHA9_9PEZI|nr:hypothetical protein DL546_009036 [Coniochaeta pulveracea]